MAQFPTNKPNDFTVQLAEPLRLSDEWEVALLDIQYPLNVRNTTLFIYTDIIQYQRVGDIQAPLLAVIPVEKNYGTQVYWRVKEPTYLPIIQCAALPTITIRLYTDTGDKFQTSGLLMCRLHFRRKGTLV